MSNKLLLKEMPSNPEMGAPSEIRANANPAIDLSRFIVCEKVLIKNLFSIFIELQSL